VLATPSTPLGAQARAASSALADAGLGVADVDGLFTAGSWGIPGPGQFPTATLAEYLGINPRYADGTNIGGAAFEAHLGHAVTAIEAGRCEVVLISYGSTQRSGPRTLGNFASPVYASQYEAPTGLPLPVGGYALAASRYLALSGASCADLASVAVVARHWAALNPQATKRELITVEDVLASPLVCEPLHVLDCCLVTDGAGAVVVTTAERAAAPYPVALVDLDDGCRILMRVHRDDSSAARVGAPAYVDFQVIDDELTMPVLRIAASGAEEAE
jgi:acetyl-CoA acetyltransferase